jgi:hypothetical protein
MKFSKKRRTMRPKRRKSRKTRKTVYKMRGGALTEDQKTCFRNLRATLSTGNTISLDDFVDKPKFDRAVNDHFNNSAAIDAFCRNTSAYNIANTITSIKGIYVMKYV